MADGGRQERHVALLVEDEPEMAAELGELLQSLGYDHVHAATQVAAKRLADEGGFCFVILDLQIKVDEDSIKPRVEAGQHLLEHIRGCYPRRNGDGNHCMQVLVMSGHAKEHHYVVKAFQTGADDFLVKPLSDKIRDALRKSQRERHPDCAAVVKVARTSDPSPVPHIRLEVTAIQHGERIEVKIDDRSARISAGPFVILLHLVAGRLRDGDGWVHRNDMGATVEQGWKGVSRLNEQLRPAMREGVAFYENDLRGSYRLHPDVELAPVDCCGLAPLLGGTAGTLVAEIASLLDTA